MRDFGFDGTGRRVWIVKFYLAGSGNASRNGILRHVVLPSLLAASLGGRWRLRASPGDPIRIARAHLTAYSS
jgi:hypothetical protein